MIQVVETLELDPLVVVVETVVVVVVGVEETVVLKGLQGQRFLFRVKFEFSC